MLDKKRRYARIKLVSYTAPGRFRKGFRVRKDLPAPGESARGVELMYAIIETGGKQYRVIEGEQLQIEKLPVTPGKTVAVDRVLAIGGEGGLIVGAPFVAGAKVFLKAVRHGRGRKIIVFKYKAKKNYRRKKGHRQPFTQVVVERIDPGAPAQSSSTTGI